MSHKRQLWPKDGGSEDSSSGSRKIQKLNEQTPVLGNNQPAAGQVDSGGAEAQGGGSAGGISGGGGGSAGPTQMLGQRGNRKVHEESFTFAGTTWMKDATSGGGGDNNWFVFPWEWFQDYMDHNYMAHVHSNYMYWKPVHIHFELMNPMIVQDNAPGANGVVQSGINSQAQIFGYMDSNYIMGLNTSRHKDPERKTPISALQMQTWLSSISHNGYWGGPQYMMQAGLTGNNQGINTSNPEVKQMGVGYGQTMDFGWHCKGAYWRSTEEFMTGQGLAPTSAAPTVNSYSPFVVNRFDERLGYTTIQQESKLPLNLGSHGTLMYYNDICTSGEKDPVWHYTAAKGILANNPPAVGDLLNGLALPTLPMLSMVVDPDPIPKIMFQLQQQVGALQTGTSASAAQIQFKVTYKMEFTGKKPRMMPEKGDQNALCGPMKPGSGFGSQRFDSTQIPIFHPCNTDYALTVHNYPDIYKEPTFDEAMEY